MLLLRLTLLSCLLLAVNALPLARDDSGEPDVRDATLILGKLDLVTVFGKTVGASWQTMLNALGPF